MAQQRRRRSISGRFREFRPSETVQAQTHVTLLIWLNVRNPVASISRESNISKAPIFLTVSFQRMEEGIHKIFYICICRRSAVRARLNGRGSLGHAQPVVEYQDDIYEQRHDESLSRQDQR